MDRELLLLGLLRRQDMHGYRLHDFIERYMAMCVDLKKSTAYYLLDKLARQGWIEQNEEHAGNRPTRHIYSLTLAGEARFQELLRHNLSTYSPAHFSSMVGPAFLDALDLAEAASLLKERRAALETLLARAREVPAHKGSMQLVVEHQIAHLEAELEWLEALIARIDPAT